MANVSSVESIKHWGTLQITYTVDDDFYYNNIDFDGDSEVDLIHALQSVLTGTPDVTDGNSGFASYAINQFNLVSALQITPELGNPEDADIGFFKANRIQPSGDRKLGVTQPFFDAVSSDDFEYAGIAVSKNVTFAANEEQFTYLHELGHAVGLEHPNAGDGSDINFNQTMTVMSSRTADMAIGVAAFAGIKYATSFMSFDIAALQDKYGKPVSDSNPDSYNSIFDGSTTVQTIWDNGGTDEIDLSGQNDGVTIDLREAVDSSGDFHDYKTIVGNQWTYIARGADIENAKGGSDNDIIHGNDARALVTSGNASYAAFNGNNILEGNGGDDQIYGHGGNDILIGGDDDDLLVGGAGADTYVIDIADTGTDTIDDDTGSLEIDGTYVGDFFGLALEGTLDSGIAIEDPDIDNIWTLGDYTLSLNNNGQDLLIDGPLQDILLKNFQDGDYGIYLGTENLDEEDIAVDETYNDAPVRYVSYYFPASGLYEVQLETLSPPANSVYQGYALDADSAYEVLADNVNGTSGNDNYINTAYLSAPRGNTTLSFGAGNDIIDSNYGRHYNQTVNAGDDRDFITTNGGAGTVNGEGGDDEFTLNPYYGLSTLTAVNGGDGRDTFNGLGAASINGGNGTDTWNVSTNGAGYSGHAVELDVSAGSLVVDGTLADISFSNIERFNIITGSADDSLLLGAGNDTISAGAGSNTVSGGAGSDFITGAGIDSIRGGDGEDYISTVSASGAGVLYGDAGNDSITAGAHNDVIYGGDGNDTINGGGGNDSIQGGIGDDQIEDNSGNNLLEGGDGNDYLTGSGTIYGGSGNDGLSGATSIDGGADNDNISGTASSDSLLGGDGNDIIFSDDGDDTVDGGAGQDSLYAGSGNNLISAGSGADTVYSFEGSDTVQGDDGDDYIEGGTGADSIDGGSDNDDLRGGDGDDTIYGGAGNDRIIDGVGINIIDGGDGDDSITGSSGAHGGDGDDTINASWQTGETPNFELFGDAGNDSILGGSWHDTLIGAAGADKLWGGDGNDMISGGAGADSLTGGNGTDTLSYVGASSAIAVDLGAGTGSLGDAAGDTIIEFENVFGSAYADQITGNSLANNLVGDVGNDTIDGGLGNDTIRGGEGADLLIGGSGTDTLTYTAAGSAITIDLALGLGVAGEANGDTVSGFENVFGGNFGDLIFGSILNNALYGNGGDDFIYGGGGSDTIFGGAGADYLDGEGGTDTLSYTTATSGITIDLNSGSGSFGDAYGDTVSGFENVQGSNFGDTVTGSSGNNSISVGAGSDVINGGSGNDTLTGGADNDVFYFIGSHGADTINDFQGVGVTVGDIIQISGSSYGALSFAQSGANTIITTATGTITLIGITAASMTVDDFTFV